VEKTVDYSCGLDKKTEVTIIYRIIKTQAFLTITHQELAPQNWKISFDRGGKSEATGWHGPEQQTPLETVRSCCLLPVWNV